MGYVTKCYAVIILAFALTNSIESLRFPRPSSLNFTEIAARYEYLTQEHTVVTEDGYILTIFRIIQGKQCTKPKKKPPVILHHGFVQSSDSWLDSGPSASLAYFLADQCFDLWVTNDRGNYYGRRHKFLDPDKDPEFWRFSVDEMGKYDIPANIDYVLNYTGAAKVNYIGFSQGGISFFIMGSERPKYCNKVQVKIGLSPGSRLFNVKSLPLRSLAKFYETFEKPIEGLGIYEGFFKGGAIQLLLETTCQLKTAYPLCESLISLVDARNPESINQETMSQIFQHIPSGTSIQNGIRYGQAITDENFSKFNYGAIQNLKLYGSLKPPIYNLSAVTTPVVVIYGNNDHLVAKEDIKYLINKLPNVLEAFLVRDPMWTHFDQSYSQFAPEQTFPKIMEYLNKYSY